MTGHLIVAIIQRRDLDELRRNLNEAGFSFTHVASYGGFLMESNDTLFIAVDEDQIEPVLSIIEKCCQSRTRYLSPISPMPNTLGRSRNSGTIASTSRAKPGSSASLGLMQIHEKWRMPYAAARWGSNSVSCRK